MSGRLAGSQSVTACGSIKRFSDFGEESRWVDDEHFELGTTHEPQTETRRSDWIVTARVADGVGVSCLLSCIWLPLGLLESPVLPRVSSRKAFSCQVSADRRIYTTSELRHC